LKIQKKTMNSFKTTSRKLAIGSIYTFSFTIGSFPFVASVAFVLFLLFNVLSVFMNKTEKRSKSFFHYVPVWGVFILFAIGFFYAINLDYGLKVLIRSLALLLVPLVFWLRNGISNEIYIKTKHYFIKGIAFVCLLGLLFASINYFHHGDLSAFFYFNFSTPLHHHPTFISIYILTALVFLFEDKKIKQKIKMLLMLFFILMILLLQSRTGLIALALILVIYSIKLKSIRKQLVLVLGVFILTIFFSSNLKQRIGNMTSIYSQTQDIGTFDEDGVNQRTWLWENGFDQIKKRIIFGYGLGSQKTLFHWQIEKQLLENEYNPTYQIAAKNLSKLGLHNQYLQLWYEQGIIGVFGFMVLVGIFVKKLYSAKQYYQILILIILLIFLIPENFFASQKGIYYFSFIFSLFLSKYSNNFPYSSR